MRKEQGQGHGATNGICLNHYPSWKQAFAASNWDVSAFQNSTNTHGGPVPGPSDTRRPGRTSAALGVGPRAQSKVRVGSSKGFVPP